MAGRDLLHDPLERTVATSADSGRINFGQWTALTAALLGWMFDGAEMGVFSLVGRRALEDLIPVSEAGSRDLWFGIITAGFLVGAATGGVVFGWLGDRIGRVRAMTLSVLVYALFTGLCGFSQQAWQLGVMRFVAALGMGGEWSLGVALVMEVWPNRSRTFMAGLIGAAANVGYMLVGFVGIYLATILADLGGWLPAIGVSQALTDTLLHNNGWRIMMMLGVTPALLTLFIQTFVPESHKWEEEKRSGATSNWAAVDLLGVLVGALGPMLIVYVWASEFSTLIRAAGTLTGLVIAVLGYTYPVMRYLQRSTRVGDDHSRDWKPTLAKMMLAAGLSAVALLGTWGTTQWAPKWADGLAKLAGGQVAGAAEWTQIWSSIGAIVGTIVAALLGDWLGRRFAYTLLCVTALVSVWVFYLTNDVNTYGTVYFFVTMFLAGACSASFYGWLPLYLPELFHTNVRATGQGFGFNFGRILAAVGVLQVSNLFAHKMTIFGRELTGQPLACSLMALIYVVGIGLIWIAPETRGKGLPE